MKFKLEEHIANVSVLKILRSNILVENLPLRKLRGSKTVRLPELETIGEGWFADSNVEEVVVPASVRRILKGAFVGCDRLKSVIFQEGGALEAIGESAFRDCAIEQLKIPKRVKIIERRAFLYCAMLKEIKFQEGSML